MLEGDGGSVGRKRAEQGVTLRTIDPIRSGACALATPSTDEASCRRRGALRNVDGGTSASHDSVLALPSVSSFRSYTRPSVAIPSSTYIYTHTRIYTSLSLSLSLSLSVSLLSLSLSVTLFSSRPGRSTSGSATRDRTEGEERAECIETPVRVAEFALSRASS